MEFKKRLPNRLTEGSKDPSYGFPPKAPSTHNPFANAFTGRPSTQPSNPIKPTKPVKQAAPAATGLNKYKKAPSKAAAPKGQFKKYMVEANNVFYQERPELKELERVKLCKWALILVWIVLASSYFLIGSIKPYEGVCPPRATCGVFVHCPELFEYHKATNQCKLSKDFIAEIEEVARNHVDKLQLEYGQRECYQQEGVPSFNIRDLFEHIDSDKLPIYREAAEKFFLSKQNQQSYGFKVLGYSGIVQPTQKAYSLRCRALMVITNTFQLTVVIGCLLGIAIIIWIALLVVKSRRSSRIYNYLKQCVMEAEDKTLNISLARNDLQTKFGPISDDQWYRVDAVRAGDKKIAYFEDDFLYWKASA